MFKGERIVKNRHRHVERDAMVLIIGRGLCVVPLEMIIPHDTAAPPHWARITVVQRVMKIVIVSVSLMANTKSIAAHEGWINRKGFGVRARKPAISVPLTHSGTKALLRSSTEQPPSSHWSKRLE
jgi:hypothetical protein